MDPIPRDIEAYVRTDASARTPHPGDLGVVRRLIRRRRRRAVAAAAAGVLTVVAGAGAVATLNRPAPTPAPAVAPSVAPTAAASSPPAAYPVSTRPDRQLLQNPFGRYSTVRQTTPVRLAADDHIGEVLPDLTVKRHRVQGADAWDRAIGLPDGRIVALGPRDLKPGVERTDGPNISGLEYNLVVVGADGKVDLRRDVRVKGQAVVLAGATETTAYLFRPKGLVSHQLATGAERLLTPKSKLGVKELPGPDLEAYDLGGGRLALARSGAACELSIFDLASGDVLPSAALGTLGCEWVTALRFSPSGDRVAAAFQTGAGDGYRFAVIDTATGRAVRADNQGWRGDGSDADQSAMAELAWQPDGTVRAMIVRIGSGSNELVGVGLPGS
jgi:hypothetical protein